MLKRIVFWGATGQAKVLREFIGQIGYTLIALFDNDTRVGPPFPDIPLYYGTEGFKSWQKEQESRETAGLIAIGGSRGRDRLGIQRFLESNHIKPIIAIHPTAFVPTDAQISEGSQILAHSTVCTGVRMGEACIINTASSVGHETVLGKGVHIGPGVTLAGCVSVDDYSFIGAGAVVLPWLKIGSDVIVGAGSVVTKDIPDGTVVYGNPAKIQRDNILRYHDNP